MLAIYLHVTPDEALIGHCIGICIELNILEHYKVTGIDCGGQESLEDQQCTSVIYRVREPVPRPYCATSLQNTPILHGNNQARCVFM